MVVRFTMTWDRVLTSEKEGLSVPVPGFSVLHATSWILETGPSELAPSVAKCTVPSLQRTFRAL